MSRNYSFLDRTLHHLAFDAPFIQRVLGDLEDDLFKRRLEPVSSRDEVFVTGLPRAGTTLMLDLLHATGEFATLTYRDMPFILSPLLWEKMSKGFRKQGTRVERAHGDGVAVSYDSPEAFEEVVWLAYLRSLIVKVRSLSTVSVGETTDEFDAAMRTFVRKVIARSGGTPEQVSPLRYLSKNNANVSRLEVISELFPTATVLILFRNPVDHVRSLMRQHDRFSKEHAEDAFSRRYMEWIGHYEFGANLRPINFEGWLDEEPQPLAVDEEFWLRYWTAAYTHALRHATDNVRFVDFDGLLRDGEGALRRVARAVRLADGRKLAGAAATLRSPTTKPAGSDRRFKGEAWERARTLHSSLESAAL